MARVDVPGLGQKLRLLAQRRGRDGWELLAARFGRSPATLRYWGLGNDARPPGMLPSEHLATFEALIREALDDGVPSSSVAELVFGSPALLEHALAGQRVEALTELIERYAEPKSVTLLSAQDAELVHLDRKPIPRPNLIVALGEPFRLVFHEMPPLKVATYLQKSPGGWGYVGGGHATRGGDHRFPGEDSGGLPMTMTERQEVGLHRFIVIGLRHPPQVSLGRFEREGLPLDLTTLSVLAASLRDAGPGERIVVFADVQVENTKP